MIYDYYLAGPFFTPVQLILQTTIEYIMQAYGKTYFSPRLHAGVLPKNPTVEEMNKVFQADLDGIKCCKALFANVSYRDTGTSVEIGYALSRNIPVILYWNKDFHDSDTVNLMIASACGGKYINSVYQLDKYLKTGVLPDNPLFDVE